MGQILYMLSILGIMFGMLYVIVIIPDKKKRKIYGKMIEAMKVNDKVVSRGGIVGKVVNIKDDYIILETGPDRARIKMLKTGIFTVESESVIEETE